VLAHEARDLGDRQPYRFRTHLLLCDRLGHAAYS
jgi:hypothetical protein